MSQVHKTKVGIALASAWAWFHHLLPTGKVTIADLQSKLEEGVTVINIGREIEADVKAAGTDPAKVTKSIADSLIKHLPELPEEMKGTHAEEVLIGWCHQVTGIDLSIIEAGVKAALAGKQ